MTISVDISDAAPVSILSVTEVGNHRHVRLPGADLSDLPQDVREAIEAHWSPERVAEWEAEQAAALAATASPPSPEQMMGLLRAERDQRLATTDWLVRRHEDELALGLNTTLSTQGYIDLLIYRQALRDLPESTVDPASPVWPLDPLV